MYIHKNTHAQTHVHTHRHMYTHTCRHMYRYTHTHPYKKLQYFVVHSQSRVLHCSGRQRAQHTLLPLLSLRSAIEQSDSSQCQ
ncbi:unnamed protein product [Staurois parvus]|uniref:Uncharacterized protein n=1 Tax=Staurois parvus TaxID=386267 RepID=A0ABN9FPV6_9NEOB|nr:unnamed protein product [Staurois parvus]